MPTTIRARYVFPIDGPPIEDGVVTIDRRRIISVGRSVARADCDLASAALLPGFVNAHTHLEFGRLTAPLGSPGDDMFAWIRSVLAYRRSGEYDPAAGIAAGLAESQREGTVALGEIAQPGGPWDKRAAEALWVTSFVELLAPQRSRIDAAKLAAAAHLDATVVMRDMREPLAPPRPIRPGLSPHAPYTVHPELLLWAIELARSRGVPLAMHLAESHDEVVWLRTGGGRLGEMLAGIEGFRPEGFRLGARPLDYLQQLARAPRTLIIHGNWLEPDEIALVAAARDRMAIVYCPQTHEYFGHGPYPLNTMLAAGARVALGTDSRASSPNLSVLDAMRRAAARHSAVPPEAIVRMATLASAEALGLDDVLGSIAPGKSADLVAVALPERADGSPYELLLAADGPVVARWFAGERA